MNSHKVVPAKRALRGFTLLELLVGLTLFSLIVTSLYSALRLGARSWEAGEAHVQQTEQMRIATSFLRRSLERTYPLSVRDTKGSRVWFEGTSKSVAFVSELPAYVGNGGMHELTFNLRNVGDERDLMVTQRQLLFDEDGDLVSKKNVRTLAKNVRELKLSYFGARKRKSQPAWHEKWEDLRRLPNLVRLELESSVSGQWPELIVRLPIDGVRSLGTRRRDQEGEGEEGDDLDDDLDDDLSFEDDPDDEDFSDDDLSDDGADDR